MAACCTHRAVGRLTSGIGSTAPVLIARLCAWFSSSASGGGCLRGGHDLTSSRAAFGWLDSARGATADAAGAAPYLLEPSVVSTSSRPASTTTSGAAPAESFAAAAARSAALEDQITTDPSRFRVLTGDRPTGALHLGHYFGTLANRVRLQHAGVEILLVIADYQVITDRDSVGNLSGAVLELVADYLARRHRPGHRDDLRPQRRTGPEPADAPVLEPGHRRGTAPQPHRQGRGGRCLRTGAVRAAADLPRPPGRRHPLLPRQPRPGRPRPATPRRGHPQHRSALQRPLRCRRLRLSRTGCPADQRARPAGDRRRQDEQVPRQRH